MMLGITVPIINSAVAMAVFKAGGSAALTLNEAQKEKSSMFQLLLLSY